MVTPGNKERYFVGADEIATQKAAFYKKYPESLWTEVVYSEESVGRLSKVFRFLINTQNGTDIDDYVISEASGIVKNLSGKLEGKSILILGTGTGREMRFAREEGAVSVEGVTMGSRNKAFAEEMVGEKPTICDMHIMPWDDCSFDIIAGFQVLEHSYAPIVFLLECNRLLKVGGTVCLETPPSKTHSTDSWLHHILCPTPRQLFCLYLKSGFIPTKFNDININDVKSDESNDWFDNVDKMVYMEAVKADPLTYERGDLRRFYEVFGGSGFSY